MSTVTQGTLPTEGALPELESVYWRPRVSDPSLRRTGRIWTAITVAHTIPFVAVAALLLALKPVTAPVALMALAQAWIIPELYAARGANVLRSRPPADADAERVSVGLLGDLLDHDARELHRATGVVLERGSLGVWLIGEAGAVLVRPRGRRVHCYCVKVPAPELPSGDRVAHLLLALRTDETGFATVANLAFSGARWRLARRLKAPVREALPAAVAAARRMR
jgi:hypothetical protein